MVRQLDGCRLLACTQGLVPLGRQSQESCMATCDLRCEQLSIPWPAPSVLPPLHSTVCVVPRPCPGAISEFPSGISKVQSLQLSLPTSWRTQAAHDYEAVLIPIFRLEQPKQIDRFDCHTSCLKNGAVVSHEHVGVDVAARPSGKHRGLYGGATEHRKKRTARSTRQRARTRAEPLG